MIDLKALAEPFTAEQIEWRVQSCGVGNNGPWAKVVPYITNRAIMHRLDAVCGVGGWKNEYRELAAYRGENKAEAGFLCGISIYLPVMADGDRPSDHQWVTKWDGANCTDIETIKGGLSDAMKRAAVQWGIGRYIYDMEESWAECRDVTKETKGARYQKPKEGPPFYWLPPQLPLWAVPKPKETLDMKRRRIAAMWKHKMPDPRYLNRFPCEVKFDATTDDCKILTGSTFLVMSDLCLDLIESFLRDGVLPEEKK